MTGSICVFAEQWRGRISEATFEALALGRELADRLGVKLTAVLTGSNAKGLAESLGAADLVVYVDHPLLADTTPQICSDALVQALADRRPKALIVPLTNVSLGVGTIVSARLNVGCVNFCKDVKVIDGQIRADCVMYGGKIEAAVEAGGEPVVLGLWPGARNAENGRVERPVAVEEFAVTLREPAVKLKRYIEPESGDVDLTKLDAVVAVGRGIQSKDNIALAEELAKVLGGAVAGSRPVIDQGWLPLSRQVGKSGLTVKPKVYVALGISGAPEHVEGMKDSATIIAVNSDARAPIFNVAHYGIVGDALEIAPALTAAMEAKRAAGSHV
jgi:electron transfer flavoprotein alpha subunit